MKKSRSFIHYGKVLLIFAIFMLVPFTGCKNIFVPEPPATPEAAGSGGVITVTLRLFTGSARTVMPEYTETGSLNWKITASQGETAVEASGAYPDYTLSLPSAGSWTFTVSGNNSDGQEIFTGSVRMEITGTTATVSIPLSPGSAMTTGTGKIRLTLTVPDTVKEVMYKLDTDETFSGLTPGNDNIYTLEKADVPAGTHTLSLYFLDEDNTTLYMCKETVNVWGGMTSDQWINTGNSAYINSEGKFELTETIIDEFLETMGSVVYVDGDSGSDDSDGVGSIFAPVASVSKAVEILRKANTKANYSATIMVSGETTIDQEIEVNSGETLTVKGTGENASITNDKGRVFNITGGSLTLEENITLTGTVTDDNGGAVYVDGGTFTMESGSKITGSSAKYEGTGGNGGAVYVAENGTFIMNDGSKITGSSATGTMSYGGAVFIYKKGTFNMNGGVIGGSGDKEKNTAVCGGGVYVFTDGTFEMSGSAQIQGNEATGTDESSGGGVYVNGGEFSMEGSAIIQGNKAATTGDSVQYGGGGVYVNGGKFTMTGKAEIKDNQTIGKSGTGGGVHIWNSNFTMGDNTCIESNSTEHGGGGVYLGNFSTFTMYGNARIMSNNVEGNADVYGGGVSVNTGSSFTIIDKDSSISIKNNTIKGTNTYGGGVFVNNKTSVKFTVNGNPTITGNTANGNADNNVYLGSGKTITIGDEGLTGGTIGVTAENVPSGSAVQITNGDVNGAAGIFTSDMSDRAVHSINGNVYMVDTTPGNAPEVAYVDTNGTTNFNTFAQAYAVQATTITLLQDITPTTAIGFTWPIVFDWTCTLDLNGHAINRELSSDSDDGQVVVIRANGNLTIKDSSANSDGTGGIGKITGGYDSGNGQTYGNGGGGIYVEGGSLTLESGSITGNKTLKDGGGVYVGSGCTFTMKGGSITGNVADTNGGGVNIDSDGTFTMTGGSITGNTAADGGGVYVSSRGSFSLGAKTSDSSPIISGNQVGNNSKNNVHLGADNMLIIDGTLRKTENSGNVGISMTGGSGQFTSGWNTSGSAAPAFFFSDDNQYTVTESDGELSLTVIP